MLGCPSLLGASTLADLLHLHELLNVPMAAWQIRLQWGGGARGVIGLYSFKGDIRGSIRFYRV